MSTHQGKINPILPLIMSLGSPSFRQDTHRVLEQIQIHPPYDSCIEEIMSKKGTIRSETLLKIASVYLHDHEIEVMQKLDEFDAEIGLQYLEQLVAVKNLESIDKILSGEGDPSDILARIKDTASTSLAIIQQPRAKKLDELDKTEEEYMFEFLRYKWAKQKLYMICAYSGIGKTSTALALAKHCSELGLCVLYISITDWSESSMYHKISKLVDPLDIYYAIYNECSIFQVEAEIRHTKPDVVIVDSLKSITNYYADEERMYMELGKRAHTLRILAGEYNTCMVTTHQLVVMEEIVLPQHLQGGKSHILEHCDLALGLGVSEPSQKDKVVSCLKVRNMEAQAPHKIMIDHSDLSIKDLGKYTRPDNQSNRIRV